MPVIVSLSPIAWKLYQGRDRQQGVAMTALGYVTGDGRGETDRLLAEVARGLQAEGWPLAGVVQHNTERAGQTRCDMDLQVLGRAERVRISQSLGGAAQGCRLDANGLETAVGLVEASLPEARLLIVNKFGKAEIEGRGFRLLIGEALGRGLPVLVGVKRDNLTGFAAFAEGMAEALPADAEALTAWCVARMA